MNLIDSIKSYFSKNKYDSEGFSSIIRSEKWSNLLGKDQIKMIEGVMEVSELQVRDIMIPRSSMTILEDEMSIDQMLEIIIESGHSRFPVIGDNKDEVIGILLAKDLLKFYKNEEIANYGSVTTSYFPFNPVGMSELTAHKDYEDEVLLHFFEHAVVVCDHEDTWNFDKKYDQSGLLENDVITEKDGEKVGSREEFLSLPVKPGKTVNLKVYRRRFNAPWDLNEKLNFNDYFEELEINYAPRPIEYEQVTNAEFELEKYLRSAVFIPESKQLDALLKEFRKSRNHMAIVVDEYARTAGLLTIEDVLEQIVGDIEDEYDAEDASVIKKTGDKKFIVEATIRIENFNQKFETMFLDEDYDTLAGMLIKEQGRVPKTGEVIRVENCLFRVLEADDRRLSSIEVTLD